MHHDIDITINSIKMQKYASVTSQDPLKEIFPNIYLLRGSIQIAPLLKMNRNMIIVKEEGELTIINAVRLNEKNLEELNQLGRVKNVIRLGDFHGLDDQFYVDTYQAEFWSQRQHQTYSNLIPSKIIDHNAVSPIKSSRFFIFESAKYPESALLLEEHQLLITTDSIQYWDDWRHISLISKIVLFAMGFRLGLFIGGPWLKKVSESRGQLKNDFYKILELDFIHLVAAHGNILKNQAKVRLSEVVSQTFD